MTENWNVDRARSYHQGTRHPDGSLLDPTHRYNPQNRPRLFKRYREVETVDLEIDPERLQIPALTALSQTGYNAGAVNIPDINQIASLLYFSAGITKRIQYQGYGEMFFRAASCTGALYHIELYVVCGDLPGLEAGVYHFDPASMKLDVLRQGDFRQVVAEAAGEHPAVTAAPATIIYSDVPYRNACKYQAREYRHAYWDSGTILSHSLPAALGEKLDHHLVMGFEDALINRLLDLDLSEEFSLAVLTVGFDPQQSLPDAPEPGALDGVVEPIADEFKTFPAIQSMHQASMLFSTENVSSWRENTVRLDPPSIPGDELIPLQPVPAAEHRDDFLGEVIRRRGSSRRFARESIGFRELSTILVQSTRGIPADFTTESGLSQNMVYLIANDVRGLESGSYVLHEEQKALEQLRPGSFRQESRILALGQDLGGDCSAAVYFLTDLDEILPVYGNRGYRTAQMEASISAGKMYLAAYAQSLGATGLTFYDDQVTAFFSPHAKGKSVMFLIAIGVPG